MDATRARRGRPRDGGVVVSAPFAAATTGPGSKCHLFYYFRFYSSLKTQSIQRIIYVQ